MDRRSFKSQRWLIAGCVPLAVLWLAAAPASAQEAASDTTLIIDTAAAWEDVAKARDLAAEDRHYDAVSEYLAALANDASLVKVVAKEIAYQKLWREDADKAIFYFRRYLARHPDGDHRDVRKGLAMAYAWSGRQKEAIALYRELAAEDPSDGGVRVGLGRTLIWNNELGEGWSVLRRVEVEFPQDSPPVREGSSFMLTVLDDYTTRAEIRTAASFDSDDLDIYRVSGYASFTVLGNQLLQVMPAWALYQQPGHADINAPRLGLGLSGALAHNWAYHAFGWVDAFRSSAPLYGGTEKLDWVRPGGDMWITWLPAPRLRLDFGGSSMPVETFYALNQKIAYNQGNLSCDWRFARSFTLSGAGYYADYTDGNTRTRGAARLFWRRDGKWTIHAGPDFTYMDFSIPYPGGYWAPDWVRNGSFSVRLKTQGRKLTFRCDASIGSEKETGSDAVTVGGASARLGWRLSRNGLLAGEIGYSRSRFASASGYERKFASLSFRLMY